MWVERARDWIFWRRVARFVRDREEGSLLVVAEWMRVRAERAVERVEVMTEGDVIVQSRWNRWVIMSRSGFER